MMRVRAWPCSGAGGVLSRPLPRCPPTERQRERRRSANRTRRRCWICVDERSSCSDVYIVKFGSFLDIFNNGSVSGILRPPISFILLYFWIYRNCTFLFILLLCASLQDGDGSTHDPIGRLPGVVHAFHGTDGGCAVLAACRVHLLCVQPRYAFYFCDTLLRSGVTVYLLQNRIRGPPCGA